MVEQPAEASPQPHASLLRELDAMLSAGSRLDVVVPATLDGLDGERPALSRAVGWHVVADAARETPVRAPDPGVVALRVSPDDETQVRYVGAIAHAWEADGWRTVPVSAMRSPPRRATPSGSARRRPRLRRSGRSAAARCSSRPTPPTTATCSRATTPARRSCACAARDRAVSSRSRSRSRPRRFRA
jgi:hypothetical protein